MLHIAYGRRFLSAAPRLPTFHPTKAPIPALAAAISSSAGSSSSSLLTTESLHARYLVFTMRELRDQLISRKLKVSGNKLQLVERLASNDVFRARKSSTFSRPGSRQGSRWEHDGGTYVPANPKSVEMEKSNPLIPAPLIPDSRSAHRNIIPKVTPIKYPVTTVSDVKNAVKSDVNALADILRPTTVEEPAYKTEQQHVEKHDKKFPVKSTTENFTSEARTTNSKESSPTVLGVTPPIKDPAEILTDEEGVAELHELANILRSLSLEKLAYVAEQQCIAKDSERRNSVKSTTENISSGAHLQEGSPAVPEAVLPTRHKATTASDAEKVAESDAEVLASISKPSTSREPAYLIEQHYGREESGTKDPVRSVAEGVANRAHTAILKEDSLLYIVANFPVEVAKDMMQDLFPTTQQHEQKQESVGHQTEPKGESSQELTKIHKLTLYTIGGLSVGWYFFGY